MNIEGYYNLVFGDLDVKTTTSHILAIISNFKNPSQIDKKKNDFKNCTITICNNFSVLD